MEPELSSESLWLGSGRLLENSKNMDFMATRKSLIDQATIMEIRDVVLTMFEILDLRL